MPSSSETRRPVVDVEKTIRISVWPVWSHVCGSRGVQTVKLGRNGRGICPGCRTEAVYTKPAPRARSTAAVQGGPTHF